RACQSFLGIGGNGHVVAFALQGQLERGGHDLVVVDDQDPRHALTFASRPNGSTMRNVVPSSRAGLNSNVPPWASTILRAIGRPRPVPSSLVLKKGSNSRS